MNISFSIFLAQLPSYTDVQFLIFTHLLFAAFLRTLQATYEILGDLLGVTRDGSVSHE